MAYNPIAAVSPQFRDQRGYYLKGYENGTTTPIAMAINVSGTTLLAKAEINEDGFIITPGQAIFIPYFEGSYDLYLFPTEADADNNDTANAIRIAVSGEGISSVISQFGDEYDPTKTYVEGDIVRYEDQYWFSKVDSNAGNVPEEGSEYWRLVMDIYATPDDLTEAVDGLNTSIDELDEKIDSKPNENLLINGGFDVWQRGTNFTKSGTDGTALYTADRWSVAYNDSANVINVNRAALATDYVITELAGKNYLGFNSATIASGSVNALRTNVENIVPLLGKTLTLSFYANTDVGVGDTFGLKIYAGLGVGGGSLPAVLDETVTMTSANLAKYTYTFTVPEAGGQVIGAGNFLNIEFVSTTVQTINITQVKLEIGDIATPYQARSIGEELALCKRYYEDGFGGYSTYATSGVASFVVIKYSVEKRINAALTTTNIFSVGFGTGNGSNSGNPESFANNRVADTTTTIGRWEFSWSADAEIYY